MIEVAKKQGVLGMASIDFMIRELHLHYIGNSVFLFGYGIRIH
jgi:hypothetical protein